jgi:hypothetical protein
MNLLGLDITCTENETSVVPTQLAGNILCSGDHCNTDSRLRYSPDQKNDDSVVDSSDILDGALDRLIIHDCDS